MLEHVEAQHELEALRLDRQRIRPSDALLESRGAPFGGALEGGVHAYYWVVEPFCDPTGARPDLENTRVRTPSIAQQLQNCVVAQRSVQSRVGGPEVSGQRRRHAARS
jgi:hypothetical protein